MFSNLHRVFFAQRTNRHLAEDKGARFSGPHKPHKCGKDTSFLISRERSAKSGDPPLSYFHEASVTQSAASQPHRNWNGAHTKQCQSGFHILTRVRNYP
ncbi:hypothetical protein AVEN_194091-1 [Araneus ventricosus]|uniref:Uncharacterized protein n=1 Tax=Araneus ventricosus TaxID=182803 RepID=A0A4Y2JAJ2_ARAVE|nr:hypothetical protein AVEN_194091-1 [Araneus ventricosus]